MTEEHYEPGHEYLEMRERCLKMAKVLRWVIQYKSVKDSWGNVANLETAYRMILDTIIYINEMM